MNHSETTDATSVEKSSIYMKPEYEMLFEKLCDLYFTVKDMVNAILKRLFQTTFFVGRRGKCIFNKLLRNC
jgi:hypothetical protein